TLDPAGNIYISDQGQSSQVKVFSSEGKFIRGIGQPGLPQPGPYNPRQMHHPNGITIDSRGHLWVAETDSLPKRVSVWTLDGALAHAFYGPMEYGGGGSLDPRDKSRFYYEGMEFALDWKTGANRPVDIYYQSQDDPLGLSVSFRSRAPETALYHNGQRFLTDCYNVNPTNAADSAAIWRMDATGVARPAAALGSGGDWPKLLTGPYRSRVPAGLDVKHALFAWTDLNGDGKPEPGEVVVAKGDTSGVTVMPDLSFVVSYLDGRAVQFQPVGYTRQGAPRYDLAHGRVLATGTRKPQTSGGGQALTAGSGWTILTVPPEPFVPQASMAGVRGGAPLWT
ncbi:MAG: hypothetical protein LC772_06525, partial [Chloroflexi bacterium]|nr:hypothetical protein [Chloroflexota bacterium]